MGIFDQAKDMYKLQKQAKKMKQDLKNLHIEAEVDGITITVTAEMEIVKLHIPEEWLTPEKATALQEALVKVINKAMKKAQEVAAEKMRDMMGGLGLNLPGMES